MHAGHTEHADLSLGQQPHGTTHIGLVDQLPSGLGRTWALRGDRICRICALGLPPCQVMIVAKAGLVNGPQGVLRHFVELQVTGAEGCTKWWDDPFPIARAVAPGLELQIVPIPKLMQQSLMLDNTQPTGLKRVQNGLVNDQRGPILPQIAESVGTAHSHLFGHEACQVVPPSVRQVSHNLGVRVPPVEWARRVHQAPNLQINAGHQRSGVPPQPQL
mmetsp:Transcript_28301/g.45643  ORF Transcript_28301/g.45643 Transcript_28301/m.45643 type:complete len:217 (-) Transcript_28301:1079-1729(-)